MKLSALKIDSKAIEAGEWIDAPGLSGIEFRVRGLGNADYRRMQGKLTDAVPRDKRLKGRIDPLEADKISTTLILDTLLLDWKGIDDDVDGAPLPYSREVAEKLLQDPDFRALRDSILSAAAMVGELRDEDAENDAKN